MKNLKDTIYKLFLYILIFPTFAYMKNLFTLAALAILAIGCTKTKTVTVTVPVHDTTIQIDTIYTPTLLLGSWVGTSPTYLKPTFTNNILSWDNGYSYQYAASHDTIYHIFSYKNITPVFTYHLSASSDTLYLTNTSPLYVTTSYTRAN